MSHRALLVLTLTSASCARSAGVSPLRFAWPATAQARVTKTTSVDGHTATLRFDVRASSDRDQRLVTQTSFEIVAMDDADVNDTNVRAALAPTLALAASLPTLRIGPDGHVQGYEGLDAMVDHTVKVLEATEDGDAASLAATAQYLRSPAGRARMEASASAAWRSWVELWAGRTRAVGSAVASTEKLPIVAGAEIEARVTFENHGPAASNPSLIRLTAHAVLEGDEAKATVMRVLTAQMQAMNGPAPPANLVTSARLEYRVECITDPKTLMPREVRVETHNQIDVASVGDADLRTAATSLVYVTSPDGHRADRIDAYQFDWR